MGHWTLDDVPWNDFDPRKADPETQRIVKAASLVEYNGGEYVRYLCNVFSDDPEFQGLARQWGLEEVQHGAVLARWAKLADPDFDFEDAFKRFVDGYKLETDVAASIRGSRSGELIARCIVETGTSSFYSALMEATEEPVLKDICRRIAADELRHYKLFYSRLRQYLDAEGLGFWGRLRVAAGRIAESEDDELAYAYYAANFARGKEEEPYDRKRYNQAYARRAYAVYRPHHVDRSMAMVFKAVGLTPNGWLNRMASKLAWTLLQNRTRRLERIAA
ncbi:MAG TPA: ferritin-like domain-containing protein [Stellaceae bacterium]|nr:ferritin-like domain-containing protein [Stellaceae bacterium]